MLPVILLSSSRASAIIAAGDELVHILVQDQLELHKDDIVVDVGGLVTQAQSAYCCMATLVHAQGVPESRHASWYAALQTDRTVPSLEHAHWPSHPGFTVMMTLTC